MFLGRRKSTVR